MPSTYEILRQNSADYYERYITSARDHFMIGGSAIFRMDFMCRIEACGVKDLPSVGDTN